VLSQFGNNKPVADFYCGNCSEEYELKSKHGEVGKKIVDGAYTTMIQRLRSENNPNFFFLTYNKSTLEIRNFLTIPKYFFVPAIIEKRKALASTARRAGWVGCNIDVSNVPDLGKIFFVQNGLVRSKDEVLEKWSKTEFVKSTGNIEAKGWLLDVLVCVERIKKQEFSLDDVYAFEGYLQAKHPENHNVKAKVRQQLQFLRDKGVIEFMGRGRYRMKLIDMKM
jgi:type II restriction enzyme